MDGEVRKPGRQRSEVSRAAILDATIALFAEGGAAGLTIEGIAARAGVGKQTVYRWWPGKADVLLEAIAFGVDARVPTHDRGSWRADLKAFVDASFALSRKEVVPDALRALMAEAQVDEAFAGRFREGFLVPRREALRVLTDRAAARGDLPAGLRPGTIADLFFGVAWYRMLATREPFDRKLRDELLALLS